MKKLFLIVSILFLTVLLDVRSQEKPFRIGLELGFPVIVGLNFEYVTPFFDKKLSGNIGASYTGDILGDESIYEYFHLETGANYYLLKAGEGLYSGISIGIRGGQHITGDPNIGLSYHNFGIGFINFKIGGKFGNKLYFRPEVGYAAPLGQRRYVAYYFRSRTSEGISYPDILFNNFYIDIGFGIAF